MCGKRSLVQKWIMGIFRLSVYPAPNFFFLAGIFGYLNYLVPRSRQYILEALLKGLQRLEYRGYDSAGIAFDGEAHPGSTNDLRQTR